MTDQEKDKTGAENDQASVEAGPSKGNEQAKDDEQEMLLPKINFSTFIFSLNSSALVHLGIVDDPSIGKKVKNLPMAKQTIDILAILEEKSKGNLTMDEEQMLKNILYDLRILYIKEKE
ncbi:MAG: DUF1844 domain-containing protein [Desulfobacteraceae bacterium]|nr:DUF1844 domain-containing protein [Desulfobacteraceae bacterium]